MKHVMKHIQRLEEYRQIVIIANMQKSIVKTDSESTSTIGVVIIDTR